MRTTSISLHNIVELSIALRNHDHAITLVCHWSTYSYGSQECINWCRRDQDLKSVEPKAKNEQKQSRNRKPSIRNEIESKEPLKP